jgi:hypothetical protein
MCFSCRVDFSGDGPGPGTGAEVAAAKAAPMVPDDSEKAVEELRPSASSDKND